MHPYMNTVINIKLKLIVRNHEREFSEHHQEEEENKGI